MKHSHLLTASLVAVLLFEGCAVGAGPSTNTPAASPQSPAATEVAPTVTPQTTLLAVPSPTRRSGDVFATISPIPIPSVTAIPPTSIYSPTPPSFIRTATQQAKGPPSPYQCHLDSVEPYPGQVIRPLHNFMGIWRLINSGAVTWQPNDVAFFFLNGYKFQDSHYREDYIPYVTAIGYQLNLHVPMKAPRETGLYSATWGLRTQSTHKFFCILTMFIDVENAP